MPALILDGKEVSRQILAALKPRVAALDPKLAVVLVGDNAESESYVKQKIKSCDLVGMRHEIKRLPASLTLPALLGEIDGLNADPDVSGFIVQLPLPAHLQEHVPQVIRAIDPAKDVDGFTAYNLGKMFLSREFEHLPPATPGGVTDLLDHYGLAVAGKHAVVIGRSNIAGKPLAIMLLNRGATVTVCHKGTPDIAAFTRMADMLVTAAGVPGLVTADMVQGGVVVIDIGLTRTEGGLKGDVDFEGVKRKATAITPVPGGVGPMTVARLIKNCVIAKERQRETDARNSLHEQSHPERSRRA